MARQRGGVLIALLVVLGVDLPVIVAPMGVVLACKRWVSRQPGAFNGAIRVIEGEVPGLQAKWKRGYGRWIRDILIWTNKPFLFRNEVVLADGLAGVVRAAKPGEVRRLGKQPAVVPLAVEDDGRIEVAVSAGGSGHPGRSPKMRRARARCLSPALRPRGSRARSSGQARVLTRATQSR
jgi:hypothetical protein